MNVLETARKIFKKQTEGRKRGSFWDPLMAYLFTFQLFQPQNPRAAPALGVPGRLNPAGSPEMSKELCQP